MQLIAEDGLPNAVISHQERYQTCSISGQSSKPLHAALSMSAKEKGKAQKLHQVSTATWRPECRRRMSLPPASSAAAAAQLASDVSAELHHRRAWLSRMLQHVAVPLSSCSAAEQSPAPEKRMEKTAFSSISLMRNQVLLGLPRPPVPHLACSGYTLSFSTLWRKCVEATVTHITSWLRSTGEWDRQQNESGQNPQRNKGRMNPKP